MLTVVRISLFSFLLFIGGVHAAQAALATDCTLYVAANGNDANSGRSPTAPKTLQGASKASVPGSVICLRGGTYNLFRPFYPAKNGIASAWIVYKNYGDGDVRFVWTGRSVTGAMIQFYSTSFSTGKRYIEVRGLILDGGNRIGNGIFCTHSHHLRFVGNTIQNMGSAAIATKFCDYLTADGNMMTHNGYNQGWSSAISYNSHQWLDTAPGFHSFVVNNLISGSYDGSSHHTDGNAIIMDLSNNSHDISTANTPPVLIANNVSYQNGGRCIMLGTVSNIWVVNNTCYKNALDTSKSFPEVMSAFSKNSHFINNIAYTWNNHITYAQASPNQQIVYFKNLYRGGSVNFTYPDPKQFINTDPLFVNPPVVDPTRGGQYATALSPWQLGNRLALQATSPAINKGIDPTTVPGISAAIINGLRQYVFKDITGASRPQGTGFDLGAYEYRFPK